MFGCHGNQNRAPVARDYFVSTPRHQLLCQQSAPYCLKLSCGRSQALHRWLLRGDRACASANGRCHSNEERALRRSTFPPPESADFLPTKTSAPPSVPRVHLRLRLHLHLSHLAPLPASFSSLPPFAPSSYAHRWIRRFLPHRSRRLNCDFIANRDLSVFLSGESERRWRPRSSRWRRRRR